MQVHKSYVVNDKYVRKISYKSLQMTNGETLPISQSHRNEVRVAYLLRFLLCTAQYTLFPYALLNSVVGLATIIGLCALVFWLENMIFMQDNIRTITKVLSVISMIVVLYLVIYLYNAISKSYKEKMEAELLVREKSYYYNQAQLLYQSSEELRKLRFTFKI